ncbi:MAG: large conductance mechanosensitive channel protein MscL [Sphingobacteriales bacterium]|nr:large conductance mechanosensitive channel protein MscL [Sphingobacteriales bacterium]MBP7557209.1 large conductance mechanosensitive channel protein MscL [Chitinophagaceae bacterium]NCT75591.1 large conductance mechanosensitive channel protein MscL [Chitinophagaceae bacterium]OJW30708.1 MAG: mechanosensitive ion channel protein MscL [Sphingobacteriales bacterium 46-32]
MGMLKEFRDFALKGNVVELAVAVIIGGAFGAIVSSLVDDVITPLLLAPALKAINAENLDQLTWGGTVKYGKFLSAIIKFIVIAFILFLIIKAMNSVKKKEAAAPPPPTPEEILLLREIRDNLKK